MMVKANHFKVVSTTLVVIAAEAVLAMLLLLAANPAFADAGWAPTIETVQSISSDGNIYFEGTGPPDGAVDLFEVKDEGDNKVGSSQVSDCYYLGTPLYNQYCWSVSLTGVADGTHTYYAVGFDADYGITSDPSNAVTVVVDRSIPPTVSPVGRDGETLTAPIRMLTVDFSKTMDPNTLTTSTFTVVKDGSTTPVDGGKVSWWFISGKEYRSAYLTFPSYLEGGTKYTATIKGGPEGVKDEFGVPLAEDYVWSFTTATWPTVESVSPSNGAEQVPTNTNVTATFSKDMHGFGLIWPVTNCTGCIQRFTLVKDGSTTPVDATVVYGAGSTATMDPSGELEENTTYTATVKGGTGGVEDVSSNPMAEDKVWSFTTAGASQPEDVTPPETTIDSGPSGPTNDTTPTFTFSGSDNVTSTANLNYQYQLDSGGWSTASTSTTANLTGLSEGAHLFEVRAVDEASNVDAASPSQQSFTLDATSPKVTTTTVPAAGATGVGRSTNVEAPFSEAPDPSTVTQDTLKDNFMLGKGKLSSSQLSSTTRISSSLSYDPTALKATLDPYGTTTTRLARCQWYTATVTTEVKDLAGNQLDQDATLTGLQPKLWYFKTGGC